MDLQRFFNHWNLEENPFQAEEARNDSVYARTMQGAVTHPDFQKIYGDPQHPSSSIVFGEKGSGKTAMRLLMERRLKAHNETHSGDKVWVVRYDDLNPFLDRLAHRLSRREPSKCLDKIRLRDHQDALLSIAVTELIDQFVEGEPGKVKRGLRKSLRKMDRDRRLDLAMLGLIYDQPAHGQRDERWKQLKRVLRIGQLFTRKVHAVLAIGFAVATLASAALWYFSESLSWEWKLASGAAVAGFAGFGISWIVRAFTRFSRARRIQAEIRPVEHEPRVLRDGLWDMRDNERTLHLIPDREDQDKRYEATQRFLKIIHSLGYANMVILMDRVDEPALINSDVQHMRKLIWPMLNNKFLQQEKCALKLLLPIELGKLLEREDTAFQRQARLDKQNLINPLRWTGTTLYDLCSERFRNCQREPATEFNELKDLFEENVDQRDLVDALDQMHQPRDAFKFLYAVIQRHCQNTSGDEDHYRIPRLTLEYVRQEQSQRIMNLYRGINSG